MKKILLIQGANLRWLGRRQPEYYGTTTAAELDTRLREHAKSHGYDLTIEYHDVEGEAIRRIYDAVEEGMDGIVINPAGFTYAGYALRDCMLGVKDDIPVIEIHITNVAAREIPDIPSSAARGVVYGFGLTGYDIALEAMLKVLDGQ
jgi:3-dehydroquinate dehydratase II